MWKVNQMRVGDQVRVHVNEKISVQNVTCCMGCVGKGCVVCLLLMVKDYTFSVYGAP